MKKKKTKLVKASGKTEEELKRERLEEARKERQERRKLNAELDKLTAKLNAEPSKLAKLKQQHTQNGNELAKPQPLEKEAPKPLFTEDELDKAMKKIDVNAILKKHGLEGNADNPEFGALLKQMVGIFMNEVDFKNPDKAKKQISVLRETMIGKIEEGKKKIAEEIKGKTE